MSALLPMQLCELLPRLESVTNRLDSFDSAKRRLLRQVRYFRAQQLGLVETG